MAYAAEHPFEASETQAKFFARATLGFYGFEAGLAVGALKTQNPWAMAAWGIAGGLLGAVGGEAAVNAIWAAGEFRTTDPALHLSGISGVQLSTYIDKLVSQNGLLPTQAEVLAKLAWADWQQARKADPSLTYEQYTQAIEKTRDAVVAAQAPGTILTGPNGESFGLVTMADGSMGVGEYNTQGELVAAVGPKADGTVKVSLLDQDFSGNWFERKGEVNASGEVVRVTSRNAEGEEVSTARLVTQSGQAETEVSVKLPDRPWDPDAVTPLITSEQLGTIFGSTIGQAIGGDNMFARIAAGTALSAVLGNIGQSLDIYFNPANALSLSDSAEFAFLDFGADVYAAFQGQAIGAISAFLAAELVDALGLDDGFAGSLATTVINATTNALLSTVIKNATAMADGVASASLFAGLGDGLATGVLGAVGGTLGAYLAHQLVAPENIGGVIVGNLGGAIGGAIGSALVGAPTIISSVVGAEILSTAAFAAAGQSIASIIGAVVLPGVGVLVAANDNEAARAAHAAQAA